MLTAFVFLKDGRFPIWPSGTGNLQRTAEGPLSGISGMRRRRTTMRPVRIPRAGAGDGNGAGQAGGRPSPAGQETPVPPRPQ